MPARKPMRRRARIRSITVVSVGSYSTLKRSESPGATLTTPLTFSSVSITRERASSPCMPRTRTSARVSASAMVRLRARLPGGAARAEHAHERQLLVGRERLGGERRLQPWVGARRAREQVVDARVVGALHEGAHEGLLGLLGVRARG